jgi:hypothetical protein
LGSLPGLFCLAPQVGIDPILESRQSPLKRAVDSVIDGTKTGLRQRRLRGQASRQSAKDYVKKSYCGSVHVAILKGSSTYNLDVFTLHIIPSGINLPGCALFVE